MNRDGYYWVDEIDPKDFFFGEHWCSICKHGVPVFLAPGHMDKHAKTQQWRNTQRAMFPHLGNDLFPLAG